MVDPQAQRGPVWLVGMMGAGKSTIGRLLAERLARRFIDLDKEIEAAAGSSVRELFATEGEAAFRAREAALAMRLGLQSPEAVVATGGGTACNDETMRAMKRVGMVVWVRADVDDVMARIDLSRRPLLATAPDPRATWLELGRAREQSYRRADLIVERRGRESAAVAEELAAWFEAYGPSPLGAPADDEGRPVDELEVELGPRRYPIFIDDRAGAEERFAAHLARRAPPGRSALGVLTDETVARLHLERYLAALHKRGFRAVRAVVEDGEAAKSLARAGAVAETFVAGGLDRRSVVVALGGGVVGDLGGFVASLLFRGIGFAPVPTTLLAQVDASVGGKTAVNLPSGKNLLGTFHQPLLVYVDLGALATLGTRDLASGLAEIAKHALLDGGELLGRLEARAEECAAECAADCTDRRLLGELVRASCAVKARVVAGDEREEAEEGGRVLLNLGHTVGHALEIDSHRRGEPLRHGEAVALGLVAAARVGSALEGAAPGLVDRVVALLQRLRLPVDLEGRLTPEALAAIAVDKKRVTSDGKPLVRYVALPRPGGARVEPLAPQRLVEMLCAARSSEYDSKRRSSR